MLEWEGMENSFGRLDANRTGLCVPMAAEFTGNSLRRGLMEAIYSGGSALVR